MWSLRFFLAYLLASLMIYVCLTGLNGKALRLQPMANFKMIASFNSIQFNNSVCRAATLPAKYIVAYECSILAESSIRNPKIQIENAIKYKSQMTFFLRCVAFSHVVGAPSTDLGDMVQPMPSFVSFHLHIRISLYVHDFSWLLCISYSSYTIQMPLWKKN